MGDRRRVRPSARAAAATFAVLPLVAGCGWFGDGDEAEATSVFQLDLGQCFTPVDAAEAPEEVTEIDVVPCTEPHTREVYAVVDYRPREPVADPDAFPGGEALTAFADGACAAEYRSYVGVDYQDSRYFFTYLLPSARSWVGSEDTPADRQVVCFVATTGEKLTQSVKGSGQ
jgi:hypothetical protein